MKKRDLATRPGVASPDDSAIADRAMVVELATAVEVAIAADPSAAVRDALRAWYSQHQRALPFRDAGDPYAVLVSEVMLQQTQVARVQPFYRAWMTSFPDVASLAAAPLDDVLRRWQGLGYYARARNLHRAAVEIVQRHGGRVPDEPDALRALPGVGAYTAGAVASIAFGRAVPAVDGNARRVLARLLGLRVDPSRGEGARRVEDLAAAIARGPAPGDVNQALMELGATVCRPRSPKCADCPLAGSCAAFAAGTEREIPIRATKARRARRRVLAWRIERRDDGRILVARRAEAGLLGGLWEFPMVEAGGEDGWVSRAGGDGDDDPLEATTPAGTDRGDDPIGTSPSAGERPDGDAVDFKPLGLELECVERGADVIHVFSHLELVVTPFRALARSDELMLVGDGRDHGEGDGTGSAIAEAAADYVEMRWIAPEELAGLARSTLMEKVERAMEEGRSIRRSAGSLPTGRSGCRKSWSSPHLRAP